MTSTLTRHRPDPRIIGREIEMSSLLLLCQIGGAVAFATTPTWRSSSSSSSLPLAHRASPIALAASSPWLVLPRGLLNFDATAAKKEDDVTIRMAEKGDALGLAQLCTDCFFGPQDSADGPFVFLQRSIIWSRILQQVVRRRGRHRESCIWGGLRALHGADPWRHKVTIAHLPAGLVGEPGRRSGFALPGPRAGMVAAVSIPLELTASCAVQMRR